MYATREDMTRRLSAEEIDELTAETPEMLELSLTDAETLVNSYVSVRYGLPLAVLPPVLTRLTCDIARYFLYRTEKPDSVKEGYQNALKVLKEISAGTVTLGEDTEQRPKPAGEVVFKGSSPRHFSIGKMKNL